MTFRSPDEDLEPYSFIQSMDANYNSDDPRESVSYSGTVSVCLEIDEMGDDMCPPDQIVTMPRVVGGYYEYYADDKAGNLHNWFDFGLTGSVSYFINKSLYARVTAQYGLLDVTNNDVDVDYSDLNENTRFIYQQDKDVNLNIGISLGFKF